MDQIPSLSCLLKDVIPAILPSYPCIIFSLPTGLISITLRTEFPDIFFFFFPFLYTAGMGLRAQHHTERQSTQQGTPGSILGPVRLAWWTCRWGRGSCPALVTPRRPRGSPAQGPGQHPGLAHILQGLGGRSDRTGPSGAHQSCIISAAAIPPASTSAAA